LSRNLALGDLPALHKDPFDRMPLAQANVEGMPLLTVDEQVLQYREPVLKA
jgi:PIN domain nuclease of toxin-antitoxin system